MFTKQIEELKQKEKEVEQTIDALTIATKEQKLRLAALTKARKQLEKTQEQFDVEEVADEQPDISDERITESEVTA